MISLTKEPTGSRTIDFDLHGIVGIRLIGVTQHDSASVQRQLGPIESHLPYHPDIVVRFVDKLPDTGRVQYLGMDAGFTDDAFLVMRGKHQSRVRVQIPFDKVGQHCEILCERHVAAVPLLLPVINLTALAKGALPLHASAFTYRGTGVLATGWSKGGKTETLLAFMDRGARYVGDEWVYLNGDGQSMYGIPEPIRIWDWQLSELPRFRNRVRTADRFRMNFIRRLTEVMEWATWDRIGSSGFAGRAMCKLMFVLNQQRYVQVAPRKLFGEGFHTQLAHPHKVFFVASHAASEVRVRRIDTQEIAQRMVFSLEEERRDLLSYYRKFRFAFPDRSNSLIEHAETLQRRRLLEVLEGKDAYAVYHPYPVSIPDLYDAIRPHL